MVVTIIFISTILAVVLYYYMYKTITREIIRQKNDKESVQNKKSVWISDELDKINIHLKDLNERTSRIEHAIEYLSHLEKRRVRSSNWMYEPVVVEFEPESRARYNLPKSLIEGSLCLHNKSERKRTKDYSMEEDFLYQIDPT